MVSRDVKGRWLVPLTLLGDQVIRPWFHVLALFQAKAEDRTAPKPKVHSPRQEGRLNVNRQSCARIAALVASILLSTVCTAAAQNEHYSAGTNSTRSAVPKAVPSCPPGTMLDPISNVCASIVDVRPGFQPSRRGDSTGIPDLRELRQKHRAPSPTASQSSLLPLPQSRSTPAAGGTSGPTPGGIGAGITYNQGALQAIDGSVLYTTMFFHPEGLSATNATLYWLFTTATNRSEHGVEVAGSYFNSAEGPLVSAQLAIYDWSCLPESPCADGGTASEWVYATDFATLPSCNTTRLIDQGGHLQQALRYANRTDQVDPGSPPLWQNGVYLWDYCSSAWDLIYAHSYATEQLDCSLSSACAWWGPIVETFSVDPTNTSPFAEIDEIGFENSILVHDAVQSSLAASETSFTEPQQPWVLFHSQPNSAYGAGNFVTPQAVVIRAPRTNDTVSGDVAIDTQVSSNVKWINTYIDGKYLASSPPYSFAWDSSTHAGGGHTISAVAYGYDDQEAGRDEITVNVSNPSVRIDQPASGSQVCGPVTIDTERTQEVSWLNVYIDGKYLVSSPPFSFNWNSVTVPDGAHSISASGYELDGTLVGSTAVTVQVVNSTCLSRLELPTAHGYAQTRNLAKAAYDRIATLRY